MMFSSQLETLLGHFDANVKISDEVPEYLESLGEINRETVKLEFKAAMEKDLLTEEAFERATMCTARNKDAARAFFASLYRYAFEDGAEPDLADYWDR